MMQDHPDILNRLAEAVVRMSKDEVVALCEAAGKQGIAADLTLEQGLARGMRLVGEKFANHEYFVPEVLAASKAMYAGFEILKDRLPRTTVRKAKLALGVVQGDIHDIGKNIVKVMAQAAGYEVIDLGRNVAVEQFVNAVRDGVTAIGMSALMTTTMPNMGRAIEALKKAGLRDRVKVLVGGAPVNRLFAERIGADGYAPDAHSAIEELNRLIQ